ncbi:chemotaxis protein CheZ [Natronospira proteinivora]|uniref:Protein phosphatase CheZ n=1 Tax=Natronospira proteinivora TaxID=1807133 RepID=A0ABT1G595_9GAMM|nr:protein phosphatase CheZ [Natronospira proteinivora]MCP1726455.1 chemotaxis protein CheZ [Natronospira proteinivora]
MAFEEQARADDYKQRLESMLQALEAGDEETFNQELDGLTHIREKELFVEVGKLTRELHEALKGFRMDFRLAELTEKEMPDARDRLLYVVEMTEKAAHTTLETVERLLPKAEQMASEADSLGHSWKRFMDRDMDAQEFRDLAHRLNDFLQQVNQEGEGLRSGLTEILMAQEYQDITGQIIGRVIRMVQELEAGMVDLLRVAGGKRLKSEEDAADKEQEKERRDGNLGTGPATPTDQGGGEVAQGQDEVDDLLSSLGF